MTALSARLRAAAEAERLSDAGLTSIPHPCSDDETRVALDGAPITKPYETFSRAVDAVRQLSTD